MKIPVRNLYYLFLYAWGRFPASGMRDVGVDDAPDLPNLFAMLLLQGTHRLLRRGLDRGYQAFTEETAFPRGRLRLDRMAKELTLVRGRAVCDYDELSHDVLHNRILKASMTALGRRPEVEKDTRHDLMATARRLHDVADVRLSARDFGRVQLSRNSSEYAFLMRLCEFVFWSLMPDERGAEARFRSVLEDETRMSAVFEEFLRNFLRLEAPDCRVGGEQLRWDVAGAAPEALALLPSMTTDVTVRGADRTLTIDAKYYEQALATGRYGERVRAGHLYQLVTYLQHQRLREPDRPIAGMLLYPAVDRSLRLHYELMGIPVTVATVDLGREWADVAEELRELVPECRRGSARSRAAGASPSLPSADPA